MQWQIKNENMNHNRKYGGLVSETLILKQSLQELFARLLSYAVFWKTQISISPSSVCYETNSI